MKKILILACTLATSSALGSENSTEQISTRCALAIAAVIAKVSEPKIRGEMKVSDKFLTEDRYKMQCIGTDGTSMISVIIRLKGLWRRHGVHQFDFDSSHNRLLRMTIGREGMKVLEFK
jgi:hypothetical protein